MTIQDMISKKKELGLTNEQIAEMSGVPLGTVQKVFSGQTASPRYNTLRALENTFRNFAHNNFFHYENEKMLCEQMLCEQMVCEPGHAYHVNRVSEKSIPNYSISKNKNVGDKTLEDYLALPDDKKVEMIDGVFYDMSSPTSIHQLIGGKIFMVLSLHVAKNGGSCIPFIAPMDVQLDSDDKTIVEPDVFVVCDRSKITRPRIVGAPDFVVEVLSPGNWYHDTIRKLRKYKNAGVREYWIVLPDQCNVLVYWFEEGAIPTEYTFDDQIPVRIWNGACVVDFREVEETIHFLR